MAVSVDLEQKMRIKGMNLVMVFELSNIEKVFVKKNLLLTKVNDKILFFIKNPFLMSSQFTYPKVQHKFKKNYKNY